MHESSWKFNIGKASKKHIGKDELPYITSNFKKGFEFYDFSDVFRLRYANFEPLREYPKEEMRYGPVKVRFE